MARVVGSSGYALPDPLLLEVEVEVEVVAADTEKRAGLVHERLLYAPASQTASRMRLFHYNSATAAWLND